MKQIKSSTWQDFHIVALGYPDNPNDSQMRSTINFYIRTFKYKVPCGRCRIHYAEVINKIPIRADSKTNLFNWTVDIHNAINKKLKKTLTDYDTAFTYWTSIKNSLIAEKLQYTNKKN